MSLALRWTEQAVNQLGGIAEYISVTSPIYAEQLIERILVRLGQAQAFPESGRRVPEAPTLEVRELIEWPYRLIYRLQGETIDVVAIVHGRQDVPSHLSL